MNSIGTPEQATQNRVIALFRGELGYRYLSDWSDRLTNSNVDEPLLTAHLVNEGYSLEQISRAIHLLKTEAHNQIEPSTKTTWRFTASCAMASRGVKHLRGGKTLRVIPEDCVQGPLRGGHVL